MVGFTGGAGTFNNGGIVYEWSDVIAVFENSVIVDYFTQFAGDALPGAGTDVSIGSFNVQLTQLSYRHVGGAVGVNNLTLSNGATFTQGASDFVISGRLTNNGLMNAFANTTFTGAIANNNLMTVGTGDSNVKYMRLKPVNGDFTLSGSGDMRLRDGFLTGEGGESSITDLFNSSTISGFGFIGSEFGVLSFPSNAGFLAITNTAAGVIEADVSGRTLIIQPQLTEANPIVNAGLLLASGGGTLLITQGRAIGPQIFVEQTGAGTIRALSGSTVIFDGTVVTGGTLDTRGTGVITSGGNTTRLVDLDITATALVNMGRATALEGTIENRGRMRGDNFQNVTSIDSDDVTLTGGGTFRLAGNDGGSAIVGESPGAVLTNANHTILGRGTISGGNLSVVNSGVISATPDSASLPGTGTLNLGSLAGLRNTGILQADAGGTLSMTFMAVVDNTGGTIRAIGAGSVVELREVTIEGGTLATTANGVIRAGGFNAGFVDIQTLAGTYINVNTIMDFGGSLVNRGIIAIDDAAMRINGDVSLSGGGTVLLRDNFNTAFIYGRAAGAELTNVNNTIRGDGFIGGGNMTLINRGVIAADADPLNDFDSLALFDLAAFTNTGTLEARNGATLELNTPASGAIQNAGGTIRAVGAGSVVELNNTVIAGGTLSAASGGTFDMGRATWNGRASTVTSNVDMTLDNGRVLTLIGTIVNSGDVGFTYRSGVIIGANTTLSGGGSFTISVGFESSFFTAAAAGIRLNNVAHTWAGTGSFGSNSGMVVINGAAGLITANQTGNMLAVETGSVLANNGLLSANRGILDVRDNLTGSGRLEVTNGGTLIVDQGTDQRVIFVGAAADTLSLSRREGTAGGFDFPVTGMGVGDRIRLDAGAGVGQEAAFTFTNTASGAVLSSAVFADGAGLPYLIRLNGIYSVGQFQLIGGADGAFGFVRVATRDGDAGDNVLTASAAGQRVIGLDGNDTLISRAGNDLLDGSRGSDTADFRFGASGVTVTLGTSDPQAVGGRLGLDRLIGIEHLTGSAFSDRLTGNAAANTLAGSAGNDTLDGDLGNDILLGGAGNDVYLVNAPGDRVFETTTTTSLVDAGGTDTVQSAVSFDLGAGAGVRFVENLVLTGTANLSATGNIRANVLTGNTGANTLNDGGGAGADTLAGLGGNDTYVVNNAGTRIVEAAGSGRDTLRAGVSFTLAADDDIEVMQTTDALGVAAINLTGNAGAQQITGNAGANRLHGAGGNDVLTGNGGADTFVFRTPLAGNIDTVTDFSVAGGDVIELENSIFTGLVAGVELARAAFGANDLGQATDGAQRIIYETDTGNIWFDADGDGSGGRIRFADLVGGLGLTHADFFVV